jgi:hypothetical protein
LSKKPKKKSFHQLQEDSADPDTSKAKKQKNDNDGIPVDQTSQTTSQEHDASSTQSSSSSSSLSASLSSSPSSSMHSSTCNSDDRSALELAINKIKLVQKTIAKRSNVTKNTRNNEEESPMQFPLRNDHHLFEATNLMLPIRGAPEANILLI